MLEYNKGFSLIELVVFITLVAIISVAIFVPLSEYAYKSAHVTDANKALYLAQTRMALILGQCRYQGFASCQDPCNGASPPPSSVCQTPGMNISSSISSGWTPEPANINIKTITVSVAGNAPASLSTIVTQH